MVESKLGFITVKQDGNIYTILPFDEARMGAATYLFHSTFVKESEVARLRKDELPTMYSGIFRRDADGTFTKVMD